MYSFDVKISSWYTTYDGVSIETSVLGKACSTFRQLTSQAIQSARWVKMGGQTRANIDKLPNTLDSRSLVEVTSSDRFPVD